MDNSFLKHKFATKIAHFIKSNSHLHSSNEICGFIGWDKEEEKFVVNLEQNHSPDPKNFFTISPASYYQFAKKYDMLGIFHSHIMGDEQASEFDIKMSEASCLPFIIYSLNTQKFNIYEPHSLDLNVKALARLKEKLK
jgi:proteasome lid subunit RPN8/RPN11